MMILKIRRMVCLLVTRMGILSRVRFAFHQMKELFGHVFPIRQSIMLW